MVEKALELYRKYREMILYLVFGGLTTLVNIFSYFVLTDVGEIQYLVSTAIAWVLSVLFAYFTNRVWVFQSTASGTKAYGADGKSVDLSKIPELVPFINNAAGSSSTSTASTGTTVIRSSGSTINISGRAIGHGVGLSQRGANGYGQLGYDYIEILQHYYTGVTVE